MPTKSELRRSLKTARLALSEEQRAEKSRAIQERLRNCIEWNKVKTLHVYEPIKRLGEVDISNFTQDIKDKYPNIQIYTTRQFDDIWEVVPLGSDKLTDAPDFDVVIVPMLGFDKKLQRIGYGGGFYDKFLKTQPKARKIGVCFDEGRLKNLPSEEHDVPLNMIITDRSIIDT